MANMKLFGGCIFLTIILIISMNPLIDEVTAIAEDVDATSYDIILGDLFPPLYVVLICAVLFMGIYWGFKG